MSARDPYDVLGVASSATQQEIRDAYRRRARMAHPDLSGQDSGTWMRDLNAAWDLLKSPERRATFDAASGRATTPPPAAGERSGSGSASPGAAAGGEAWRGAAGAPPGQPYGTVLDVGIYAGWSLGQVARHDRGYLAWLRDRSEGRPYAAEIARILAAAGDKPGTDDRGGRGRRGRSR